MNNVDDMTLYKYGDKTQITEHFKASEFQCKCGNAHDFSVSNELVEKLEQLREKLNCSAINLSSGFRCVQHDKNVGGSGNGQHTLGTAADICCIGKDGKPISSKLVCCAAQDIGFTGIANINDSYTYTHVDVRTGSKWYGNEIHGNAVVTNDFYKYFGIEKERKALKSGIDVSSHNGMIDWQKVKAAGIDFAILRAGYGKVASQIDTMFAANYAGAKSAGIPIGAFWYCFAKTVEEARQEASICIECLKGKQFEYPIYYDIEESDILNTGATNVSAIADAFCKALEAAGYYVGLYTFRGAIDMKLSYTMRTRYTMWLAEWGTKPSYDGDFDIWQKSDSGSINGISGDVDLDVCYRDDFPSVIKQKGLNGFGITPDEQVHKTIYNSDVSDYMQKVEKCLVDVDKAVASTISAMEELREAFEND